MDTVPRVKCKAVKTKLPCTPLVQQFRAGICLASHPPGLNSIGGQHSCAGGQGVWLVSIIFGSLQRPKWPGGGGVG